MEVVMSQISIKGCENYHIIYTLCLLVARWHQLNESLDIKSTTTDCLCVYLPMQPVYLPSANRKRLWILMAECLDKQQIDPQCVIEVVKVQQGFTRSGLWLLIGCVPLSLHICQGRTAVNDKTCFYNLQHLEPWF